MNYKLPIASATTLGGMKVGEDFEISEDGTLNIKEMSEMQQTVQDIITNVSSGKALVAEAITEKGVETAEDASYQVMHDNILQISGGVSWGIIQDFEMKNYTVIEEG